MNALQVRITNFKVSNDLFVRKCLPFRKTLLDLNKIILSMLEYSCGIGHGGEDITDKLTLT